MTFMLESSRTFLFTEYARKKCGVLHAQGTDPKVWDALPDRFSAHPLTKKLLARVAEDNLKRRKAIDYYHSIDLLRDFSSADSAVAFSDDNESTPENVTIQSEEAIQATV
jgi:homogentisate 1,2-dioxygenase